MIKSSSTERIRRQELPLERSISIRLRPSPKSSNWGTQSKVVRVGLLITLHGRVNANFYQNILLQHEVNSLHLSLNQTASFIQQNELSHTTKQLKQFIEVENIENNEMASPTSWPKHDWKYLENSWRQSNLQAPNCGRDWKCGARSDRTQSIVRDQWCAAVFKNLHCLHSVRTKKEVFTLEPCREML